MTDEFRQELNKQTIELLAKLLEDNKSYIICCVVKEMGADKYTAMMGANVGPRELVHALAQIMPGIEKWDEMTKGN